MDKLAILALLEAKPGKEQEIEEFLKSALELAEAEVGTRSWYALKLSASRFAIFDTFADETGRDGHLSGEMAKALFAKAAELFAKPPKTHQRVFSQAKAGIAQLVEQLIVIEKAIFADFSYH